MDTRLEDAVLEPAAFDLAVSATAFHWVQPDVGLARLAAATRPGGCLALWWSVYGDPGRTDPFDEELDVRLRQAAAHLVIEGGAAGTYAYDRRSRVAEIVAGGAFGPVEQVVLHWEGRHTPEGLRRMFATFSPWLAMEATERERCLDLVLRTADETAVGGRGGAALHDGAVPGVSPLSPAAARRAALRRRRAPRRRPGGRRAPGSGCWAAGAA